MLFRWVESGIGTAGEVRPARCGRRGAADKVRRAGAASRCAGEVWTARQDVPGKMTNHALCCRFYPKM